MHPSTHTQLLPVLLLLPLLLLLIVDCQMS
jgi:hypothetical protein